jgi:thiamine pyrophosphate-dependent acetolactate synthase large subunit-like protein
LAVTSESQVWTDNADLYTARAQTLRRAHAERVKAKNDDAQAVRQNTPVHPAWASYVINKVIPDEAIVVQELITHRRLLDAYLERDHAGSYMRSFGGLGQGLPNALGMKLAHPDKLVVAVLGDGSFNYNPVHACFGLCQEYGMPILTVIFNNRGYASMQRGIDHLYPGGFGERGGRDLATSIPSGPNYPKLVEAFGGWGITIEQPGELESALQAGIREVLAGRPALVDIVLEW